MRPLIRLGRAAALSLTVALPAAAQQQPIRGFPADALAAQAQREARARAVPSADSLRHLMRLLSAKPHEAGTDRSREVAEAILQRFRSYGLDARLERFEALLPRPVSRRLELVAPERYTAVLREPAVPGDEDTADADQIATFNAYSADGDVTAPLVYVNYGIPEDYKVLDSLGISVKGKIVIARYGRSWRGIKPKLAAERGAVGCIIYSDPEDDGYFVDDVYPKGPMRPEHGVQRGSVADMPTYPGDPLSPGWASEAGSRRLKREEARTLMTIPVLPISYGDALPLLRQLGGPVAPERWRGALPITYHVGPGPAEVRLAVSFDWQTRPLYNVVARIPGAVHPDQWVLYGNHHDAWVNGANDPISGMVALMETARSLGALLKTGWRPARTIVLLGWDGEEPGLLGSTEWVEKHAADLRDKAVAYLNSDTNDRGWLEVGGSHSLQTFIEQVARDVRDPKSGKSVRDAALARPRRGRAAADTGFTIAALGSGSDFTPFLDHAGIATLNVSYGGETNDGMYHSVYDTFEFYTRFLDTSFVYGVAEAQTTTTALLRLADAPVLPFEFGAVARTYGRYVEEIGKAADSVPAVRGLDLGGIRQAIDRLEAAAGRYERALAALDGARGLTTKRRHRALAEVNRLLYGTERALTDPAGLERREWFRHMIYAPGFYTGYGVKTMAGVREAVEDVPDRAVAQREAARIAAAIDRMAAQVGAATTALERALRQ